ncbi:hypothetical protein RhiJN_12195 [Ceratobasidium sp. AG-Ba]|nr:hypothetical protein RhiJN_12195 [Ceratobasidium sp. AG-Ba]
MWRRASRELGVWGLFLLLYILCINVLVRRRGAEPIQWIPLFSASLLFALSTAHIAVQLRRLYVGLVEHAHTPGGPVDYFDDMAHRLNVIGTCLYAAILFVGDSVVIHRCFLIWGKRLKVVILPVLLLLGTTATGYASIGLLTQLTPRGPSYEGSIARCTRATFILSLATNIVTTFLIAYRILTTARQVAGSVDVRPYIGGLAIIIESAAIYTFGLLVYLVIFLMKSNVAYIVFCALCPIIGIVPTLIIVRVGLGLTRTSQIDVEEPPASLPPPTYYITPLPSACLFPTPAIPSYPSSWSRSTHTRDISDSDTTSPDALDAIHLQLRYSHGSAGRAVMSDDLSRKSLTSLGLDRTRTTDSK